MRRAILLALGLLVASIAPVAAQSGDDAYDDWVEQGMCEYFEQTDKYLCFGFKSYWHDFGGLEIFGYPVTNEMEEDGRTVQYFERARFEWHPGVWPERHDVLQGLLGVELTADMADHDAFAPADAAKEGCIYYEQTGHNVCDQFADRWAMSGGLPVFGYPISEAFEDEDGTLIQYFERQRMEHQPGVWPERHDVLLGLLGLEALGEPVEPEPEPEPEPQPEVSVIAGDLVQPRGILATDHGIYIAEAGAGGDGPCIMLGSGSEGCVGESSALTLLDDEGQHRIIEGISSLVEETGEGIGIHDVALDDDGNVYAVVGLGADPTFRDELGAEGDLLGTVIQIDSEGEATLIADLGAFELAENPDGTHLDANPYGIAWDGQDLIVADAGGNSVLRVGLDGSIETVAVLEPRMVEAPPFIDAPEIPMESVPTNVAVGPDGNYYVTELTGFPFQVGGANVYQITPDGDVSVYAEGFTNLGDLAFDGHGNLWVLEIVAGGILGIDEEALGAGDFSSLASRIVMIDGDGGQTDYMFENMLFATGISVGSDGELYVVNLAVTPDAHVLRIDLVPTEEEEDETQTFSTEMSGSEEVPPAETVATGSATFVVSDDGNSVDYEVHVENLDDVTMAHIHLAPAGENGPVVVWLYPSGPPAEHIPGTTTGVLATGTFSVDDLAGPLEDEGLDALIEAMLAGETYVNVHTELYPGGEIRGQIELEHVH